MAAWGAPAGDARPEEPLPPAEAGRQLVVRLGCPGCHTIEDPAFTDLRSSGPDLRRLAAKTSPAWTFEWLTAPRQLRPTTWMPHFFDEADRREVRAVVAYLMESSLAVDYPPPPAGDAGRGEELFGNVGCSGCHLMAAVDGGRDDFDPHRLQGPNLIGLGSKVAAGWLFAWLEDPRQYDPQTTMPDLRLSDREAADLTAFLMASRAPAEETAQLPSAAEGDAEAGREAIELYGCYGCHEIAGFEDAAEEDAEKHASALDSADGFAGHGLPGLPNFALSDREAENVRAALASPEEAPAALVAGRKLVIQHNCRGCHLIEGRGQAVAATLGDDPGLLPPNLKGEGARVQPEWLAAYLADPGSVTLRPWLTVRMPTFGLSEEEIGDAVAYFSALEQRQLAPLPAAPPPARSVALGREVFDLLECGRCHPSGARAAPGTAAVTTAELAPPFAIASRRLRYQWIPSWIEDPQGWLPGTRMPTFFFPSPSGGLSTPFAAAFDSPLLTEPKARMMEHFGSEDELRAFLSDARAVIAAVSDYIWSLGEDVPDG